MSELGPEARSILEDGRDGDDPAPADRARIRASVLQAIAAKGAAGAAGSGAAAAKTGAFSFGWKLFGVIAMIGAGAGLLVIRSGTSKPAATPSAIASAAITTAAPPSSPSERPIPVLASSSIPATEAPSVASAEPVAPRPIASAARRPISASAAPIAVSAGPIAVSDPPSAPAEDTLPAETRRLREAHGAMQGGDPARAMALLDEQGAAGAELRQERAAARVLALCQLGRVDEARAAAARFLQDNPQSPIADRVRGSCAGR